MDPLVGWIVHGWSHFFGQPQSCLGNLCFDGTILEIYGFRNPYLWNMKTTFNVESYIFFMHSELVHILYRDCPLRSPGQQYLWVHVNTGRNWTAWKLKNKNLTFPQKHPSRQFFLHSLSFDTHFSHISSLCHWGEVENRV